MRVTLTADTITDEQIRELRRSVAATSADLDHDANHPVVICNVALAAPVGSLRRVQARARCAEILNARSAT
jgi:hypothetical protein